ncbi:MAG: hypothetical protein CL512_05720 [Actinobacteria bacterium]|jgi:hypothetical protein|nr:hypothetical protein [Actinomycetota bacterium]|tara:strand:+ start:2169 stop:2396 length:228 start_codon:yes stop_codon:yes gene_type:complete
MDKVKKYTPYHVERKGSKIWFSYVNEKNSPQVAFYDLNQRKLKAVVGGKQYGKDELAVRQVTDHRVVERIFNAIA